MFVCSPIPSLLCYATAKPHAFVAKSIVLPIPIGIQSVRECANRKIYMRRAKNNQTNKQTRASTKQNFYLHNNFCTLFLIYKTRCWFAFSSIDQFIIHTTTEFQPELNERSEQKKKMGLHSPMQAAFFLNIINASCSCQ